MNENLSFIDYASGIRSSIITEGIKRLFFTNFKNKKNNTNPTFNKPKKVSSSLNNQLSTKKTFPGERDIQLIEQLLKHKNIFHTPMENLL